MKVSIYGTGYVGLITGACLADSGHHVLCVDINQTKINELKQGRLPIYEPGLGTLVRRTCANGQLQFTTSYQEAVDFCKLQFIAVGTPADVTGAADLQHVFAAANEIAGCMKDPKLIVIKSTVPVGTSEAVRKIFERVMTHRNIQIDFTVAANPEFLKEGTAINDFVKPDRIIIGIDNESTKEVMIDLYGPFNRNRDRLIFMDIRSAELTKYATNAMLATKISFMNELANIAEKVGADIEQVRQGIGSDARIGYQFIYPGCGYGGSCFPKDIKALFRHAQEHGYESDMLRVVDEINTRQKKRLFHKIVHYYGNALEGKIFAIWGLAYKPKTSDMREAPSRTLIDALCAAGAQIQAYDPESMDEARKLYTSYPEIKFMTPKEAVLQEADALILCTEWQHFRAPDFALIKSKLKEPVIFDGRNMYDPEKVKQKGFKYFAIGRGDSVENLNNFLPEHKLSL